MILIEGYLAKSLCAKYKRIHCRYLKGFAKHQCEKNLKVEYWVYFRHLKLANSQKQKVRVYIVHALKDIGRLIFQ